MTISKTTFRLLPVLATLLLANSCEKPAELSKSPVETIQSKAAAYPYFQNFWDPIRERVAEQDFDIVVQDGEKAHRFACHALNEVSDPVILHVSKASVHIGNNMGKDLEDVSKEQLTTTLERLVKEANSKGERPTCVSLHVRTNVSGDRVNDVLWILADAGIQDLVAPAMESGS